MVQLRLQQILIVSVVAVLRRIHRQRGVTALARQKDLLLLPPLTTAIQQQQRGAALLYDLVVPCAAQTHPVLPCGGHAQFLAGEQRQPGIFSCLARLHAGDGLPFVGKEAVCLRRCAISKRSIAGGILTGTGHIAHYDAVLLRPCAPMAAAGHVAGGLADIHIGPCLHGRRVIAGGDLAHHTAYIVAGHIDGAVGIAITQDTAALKSQQTADGTHRHGVLQGHIHIAGVAVLNQAGGGVTHQTAGIEDLAHIHIRQMAIHGRAALHPALVDLADYHAQITAAADGAVAHTHVFHDTAVVDSMHQAAVVAGNRVGADSHSLHQQVLQLGVLHMVNEERRRQILQAEVADDMLLPVQFAGEASVRRKIDLAAVQNDHSGRQTGFGEVDIRRQLVVPVHVVVDIRPIRGCRHLFPESDILCRILLLGFACAADAVVVQHARHLIGADIIWLVGTDLHIEYHIVQAIPRHVLLHHLRHQALDIHAINAVAFVIAQTQLDVTAI